MKSIWLRAYERCEQRYPDATEAELCQLADEAVDDDIDAMLDRASGRCPNCRSADCGPSCPLWLGRPL